MKEIETIGRARARERAGEGLSERESECERAGGRDGKREGLKRESGRRRVISSSSSSSSAVVTTVSVCCCRGKRAVATGTITTSATAATANRTWTEGGEQLVGRVLGRGYEQGSSKDHEDEVGRREKS